MASRAVVADSDQDIPVSLPGLVLAAALAVIAIAALALALAIG